ncbi:MAG: asparagine synthase (glutamine-hydrolyzing) [Bacteroidetes bacterium]|nr:asparagine synthase (glutamine-hydrolyzing) [Bacteroidota bacterium]
MCGIAGFIDSSLTGDAGRETAHRMLQKIVHRGPEASNVWSEGGVTLGHNRLKIIDLSDEANQPFEYEGVVLIFNGEVYNYLEIKKELEGKGFRFRTQSDTEVVCAAYKCWGEDCVQRFMGMWAFALWDGSEQKLFCSRDRFGIKPFYYVERGASFYFASEYKALKEIPNFDRTLNLEQFKRALQFSSVVYKEETFYKNMWSLLPAHNIVWQGGILTVSRYWDIDFSQKTSNLSWEDKKEKFYLLFRESVMMHSRSDVKSGTCLSGGLDSSTISSMYSTLFPEAKMKSFSIYYENDVDERPFVREVVKKYPNIEPHYFSPNETQIADCFHRAAYHADVPLTGSSFISQYFLMQLAKNEGVTVLLDGQGADEYLGGYLHSFYRVIGQLFSSFKVVEGLSLLNNLSQREQFAVSKRRDFLMRSIAGAFSNENRMYSLEYSRVNRFLKEKKKDLNFEDKTSDRFNNFLYHTLMSTTLPTLLHFEDRNSMAFSLESRVPFLDHRLVEFAFTLSREDRINEQAETKYILRESMKKILPEVVYSRKDKKGFVTPGEKQWLSGPLRFLMDIDYSAMDWLNVSEAKHAVEEYKNGNNAFAIIAWRLGCFSYWLKNFN